MLANKVTLLASRFALPTETLKDMRDHLVLREPALWHVMGTHADDGSRDYSLDDAVALFSKKLCQDPRDKVFGLLGLVTRDDRLEIVPDYSLGTLDVFKQAVEVIMCSKHTVKYSDGALNLLGCRTLGVQMGLDRAEVRKVCEEM